MSAVGSIHFEPKHPECRPAFGWKRAQEFCHGKCGLILLSAQGRMISITLENVTKRFGQVVALDQIDLRVEPGEIFFLLGPSGCGKTTLLRSIAGFYIPDSGRILFGIMLVRRPKTIRARTCPETRWPPVSKPA